MKKIKLYLSIFLIIAGLIGLVNIRTSYDFSSNYVYRDTAERGTVFYDDGPPEWSNGGVAIDSNIDGAVAGVEIACGLMILSGSILLSKIDC